VGWGTDRNNTGLEPSLAWWRDDPSSVPPDHNNETVLPDYLELEYVEDDGGGYGSLSLSSLPQAVASGQYTLKIMLMKNGLAVAIPSVNVVVFANLTSSDTLFLDQSMFSAASEAPEQAGASSTLTYHLGAPGIAELEIVLNWNDTSLV